MIASLREFLALVWWHICHFLDYSFYIRGLKPASQFFHKVVIIGDDFAAGIGDHITLCGAGGGIAKYLKEIVANNDKVHHNWAIINAGVPRSMTADWLLSSPKKYFKNVLASKPISDASIVIIILGSAEIRKHPETTASEIKRNLTDICDTLRKKGKRVCLATVASSDPIITETDSLSLTINIALHFCKSTATDETPIVLGPRLDTYAFRRESALLFNKYHFNSQSYGQLARNTADFLIPMMTAVEWTSWKHQQSRISYDKALYE